MPRTVSSTGPKSHGFWGRRGFQEASRTPATPCPNSCVVPRVRETCTLPLIWIAAGPRSNAAPLVPEQSITGRTGLRSHRVTALPDA